MAHVNARQWQRFVYRAEVQLGWLSFPSEREQVQAAASVDLSLGGIQLMAAETPSVGASVSCRLALTTGWLILPGRVRWIRPRTHRMPGSAIGVEFGPLSQTEQLSVSELVGDIEHAGEAVELRVAGWRHPLPAIATKTERGLRLRLSVPWLSAGAVLQLDSPHAGHVLDARVIGCQLRERAETRTAELEVWVEPCEPARKRRYAIYEAPDDAPRPETEADKRARAQRERMSTHPQQALRGDVNDPEQRALRGGSADPRAALRNDMNDAEQRAPLIVPKTRVHRVIGQTILLGCLGWVLFAVTRHATHPTASLRSARVATATSPRAPLKPISHDQRPSPSTVAAPIAPSAPSPTPSSTAIETPEPPSPVTSEVKPALLTTSAPEPAADERVPTVSVLGDTTEVFVPVEGSLTNMRISIWAEPLAVVLDIPAARIPCAQSRYDIHAGGVSGVSIGRNRGVTQVRVLLSALLTRYGADATSGGVKVRMKRDLRPMPQ